jgi:hypothetical protein
MDLHYLQGVCQDETPRETVAAKSSSDICSTVGRANRKLQEWPFQAAVLEIHAAAGLPCSKPKMMNYSNMAMVWAKIVLHKDVDWRIVYGRNVSHLNRGLWMIPTN